MNVKIIVINPTEGQRPTILVTCSFSRLSLVFYGIGHLRVETETILVSLERVGKVYIFLIFYMNTIKNIFISIGYR